MGSILQFLKYIPDAAASPLAFVAYSLVVAAWVVRTWLYINPQRDTRKILALFTDDKKRLEALARIFNETPPSGLKGNEAILEWAKIKSTDKTKVLWVVAWLATLVAILIFVVAVRRASSNSSQQVTIRLHRIGTTGDCPSLPSESLVIVSHENKKLTESGVAEGCKATFAIPQSIAGQATVSLLHANPYELANPKSTYPLGVDTWNVYVTESTKAHLRISLLAYEGQCADLPSAFKTFKTILQSKTSSLRDMFVASDHRFDYLSGMNVISTEQPLNMSPEEVRNYWQETGSLQVLSGLCFKKENAEIMRSLIFSGNFSSGLPEPFVADLPISAEEFGTTRDIYTVSILLALAREAKQRKVSNDVVIVYLSRAREIASEIQLPPGKQLMAAIETFLVEVGASGKMKL